MTPEQYAVAALLLISALCIVVAIASTFQVTHRLVLWRTKRRIWREVKAQAERREMLEPYRDDAWRKRSNDICGLKCPGGSERRQCGCVGPKQCVLNRGGVR